MADRQNPVAALKTATRNAYDMLGGLDAVAACPTIRYARSYLNECANRNSERVIPLDVAMELDRLAGEPLLLTAFATYAGFILTPVDLGDGCVAAAMTEVVRGAGDLSVETVSALADGIVDEQENESLQAKLAAHHRVTGQAIGVLRAHKDSVSAVPEPLMRRG